MKKKEIIEKFSEIVGSENVVKKPANYYARCTVKNLDEFDKIIEICKEHYEDEFEKEFILRYRGQCYDAWRIVPSISRTSGYEYYEKEFLDYFSERIVKIHANPTFIDKLFFAQHYGLPTRLLDVTANSKVALWFATSSCIKNDHTECNGEVVVMPVRDVEESDVVIKYNEWQIENFEKCLGKDEKEIVEMFCKSNGYKTFEKSYDIVEVKHSFPENSKTKRITNQEAFGVLMPLIFYKREYDGSKRTGSFYSSIYRKNLISIKIDGNCKQLIRDELDNKRNINERFIYGDDLEHSSKYKISYVVDLYGDEVAGKLYGDINGDGVLNGNDYSMMVAYIRCSSNLTAEQKKVADLNGDGAVDAFDALQLDLIIHKAI